MKNISPTGVVLNLSPFIASSFLYGLLNFPLTGAISLFVLLILLLAVVSAVHHAEVIAHKVGEPYGTLILGLAVTIIETSLLISMLLSSSTKVSSLPRDTIYDTVMIICNGVVGLCLLIGGMHHKEQYFKIEGTGSGFADLPPASRTNVKFVKSVTMENDGHEKEQIYRRTDHWVLAASRSRHADQGVVPQRRI